MYIVDTSILILTVLDLYFELRSTEKFYLEKFKSIEETELIIPEFILLEFATAMQKSIPYKYKILKTPTHRDVNNSSIKFIDYIRNNYILYSPNRNEMETAIDLYIKQKTNREKELDTSLFDILLAVIANNHKYNLLTADKKLQRFFESLKND